MSLYLRQNSPTNSSLADLGSLFDPPCFKLEELPSVEDLKPSSCTTWALDDTLSTGSSLKKRNCSAKKPRTKTMLGEKALRLGNNGRRLVRSAIAKALLEKPELRERCRQVSTVKSATVKQLLRMCEIVGEREVAEDAIRQMDPTIELDREKLWENVHDEGDTLRVARDASPPGQEDIRSFFLTAHLHRPLPDLKLLDAATSKDKPTESGIGDLGAAITDPSEASWESGVQSSSSLSGACNGCKPTDDDNYETAELNIFDNPLIYNQSHQNGTCRDAPAVSSSSTPPPPPPPSNNYLGDSLAPCPVRSNPFTSSSLSTAGSSTWCSLGGIFPMRD
ncbi:hypothetical protein FOL47_009582 [Perkinsus chesapeaki]|uniref:Uncharacterized protein n=1 Tax=Perkinsus chesapeaki TaxID=330153 RepID=A0A7J6MS09_PERCH|nr:hypothetical protein FOL47_009582 [Perkinsus chesapeaki]